MPNTFNWPHSQTFLERVERLDLHGLHFQHVSLCQRRAWMYWHRINFAQWNSYVQTGIAKHLTSYSRDHSTEGLFGLAPDRLDWEKHIVYENKGTGGAVEAAANQTAFYALMLSIRTGHVWQASIHVLSTRRRRSVLMNDKRLNNLLQTSEVLESLAEQHDVPAAPKIKLCDTCSFGMFCGYA